MFVNRGMLEAAKNEGEVAGVMAHEISHVVLRHGTAQASKASKYRGLAAAGTVVGAILGGGLGRVVSAGTRFGVGSGLLEVRPGLRAPGRPRGRADHGARRLRPARHGELLQDDPAAGRIERSRVAERSPRSRQPLRHHHEGSAVAAGRTSARGGRARLRAGADPPAAAAARPDERRGEPLGVCPNIRRGRGAAVRQRRTAVGSLHAVFQPSLPTERAVELAGAPRLELDHLRPGGRLRRGERTDASSRTASRSASRAIRAATCRSPPRT